MISEPKIRHDDHDASALVLTRIFDASPDQVFRLWSDPEHVKEWWHPKDFTTPVFEMDFRVGGRYRYCIRSAKHDGWAHGSYEVIDAPRRLVFSFQWESGDAAHDAATLISIDFAPTEGQKTLMTFRQAPFTSIAARVSHADGWGQVLDAFGRSLAGVHA